MQDQFKEIVLDIFCYVKVFGVMDVVIEIFEGDGLLVLVCCGEVEMIEYNCDKMVGVIVFIGKKCGNVSMLDFLLAVIKDIVVVVYNIVCFMVEDEVVGFVEIELFEIDLCDFDLYYLWVLSVDEVVEFVCCVEDVVFVVSLQICNLEGVSVLVQYL